MGLSKYRDRSSSTSKTYKLVSAFGAAVLWGGWAYYVNGGAGPYQRVTTMVVQGGASFLITLFLVWSVTLCLNWLPDTPAQAVLPALMTVSVSGSVLVLAHLLAGTPNILTTIAPALSVAFAYCLYTTHVIRRQRVGAAR